MKYSLWCVLFGHRWWVQTKAPTYSEAGVSHVVGYCDKCGLTKAECGISNEETKS